MDIPTPLDADWVQALDQAEQDITRILNSAPKDSLLTYVNDLNTWSKRLGEEAITRTFRILYSMGYSKSAIASTLGVGGPSLTRIINDEFIPRRNTRSTVVPEDYIDLRDEFTALSEG